MFVIFHYFWGLDPCFLDLLFLLKPEASCPNVGREWGAKHSTLFKFPKKNQKIWTFLKNLFFSNLEHVFESYQFLGTGTPYYLTSRSLHSYFRSILKCSKCFNNLSLFAKKILFSQKFRRLPESQSLFNCRL